MIRIREELERKYQPKGYDKAYNIYYNPKTYEVKKIVDNNSNKFVIIRGIIDDENNLYVADNALSHGDMIKALNNISYKNRIILRYNREKDEIDKINDEYSHSAEEIVKNINVKHIAYNAKYDNNLEES